ncbi:LURP-one-related/scramblase family protein [Enterococcus sp. AZ192]|uniref:LURP-one-related/scramblase family protein n=1 Tax=Enterococcus sp. AZ192 TaxID=2774648 RepID=UPI003D2D0CD4
MRGYYMKYIVKQKLVALKPTYEILDASGNPLYKVKGSFLGRESFEITDLDGETLAMCKTNVNVLSMIGSFLRYNFKKYHISVDGESVLSIARSLNIFSYKFAIDSVLGDVSLGYGMTGSHQFKLQEKVICDIDKRKLTLGGDEYHIEVDDTQDHKTFLLTAIALDRIYYTKR